MIKVRIIVCLPFGNEASRSTSWQLFRDDLRMAPVYARSLPSRANWGFRQHTISLS